MLNNRHLPINTIKKEIVPRFLPNLELTVLRYNAKRLQGTYKDTDLNRKVPPINAGAPNKFTMACVEDHFFPNVELPVSRWFILNYAKASQLIRENKVSPPTKQSGAKYSQMVQIKPSAKGGVRAGYRRDCTLSAFHLVRLMLENNTNEQFFTTEGAQRVITQIDLKKNILPPLTAELFTNQQEPYEVKQKRRMDQLVVAADLEAYMDPMTAVDGSRYERHKPLMMAWAAVEMADAGTLYTAGQDVLRETQIVQGENCIPKAFDDIVEYFLREFPRSEDKKMKPHLYVYFHNLKYDSALIMPVMTVISSCLKNNIVYGVDLLVRGVIVHLRDSLKTLDFPLSKFKSSLNLPSGFGKVSGSLTNYRFFNTEYLEERKMTGDTQALMWHYLDTDTKSPLISELCEELESIPELEGTFSREEQTFDPLAFYAYYCKQDVVTLAGGIQKFDYILQHELQRDTSEKILFTDGMTLPSLTKRLLASRNVFEGGYGLSNILRRFALEASYGGRCCANEDFHGKIIKEGDAIAPQGLSYDDACSLYPSATWFVSEKLAGFPTGPAKLLEIYERSLAFLRTTHTYVVRIRINQIRKPMQCGIGIITRRVGNSIKYLNRMDEKQPFEVIVNNVTLEDYIEYHDIDFEILEGFYYMGEGNRLFGVELEKLYQERRRYEADGNKAVGKVIKLMLNASYGSCKPKPSASKFTYTPLLADEDGESKMDAQRLRKWPLLIGYAEIGKTVETEWLHIDQDATMEVWAGLILAVSKRLMNRVFFACSEAGAPVIYTDTDSLKYPYHLRETVEKTFDELFESSMGRPLIGKELGQFHSDFELVDPESGKTFDSDTVHSIFSIVVGRKLYLHVLTSVGTGVYGYKLSCKGFPKEAVLHYARRFYAKPEKRLKYDQELTPEVKNTQLRGLAMMFVAISQRKKLLVNMYPRELKRSNFKFVGRGNVSTSQEAIYRTMVMTGDMDPLVSTEVPKDGIIRDPTYEELDYVVESDSEMEEEQEERTRVQITEERKQLDDLVEFDRALLSGLSKPHQVLSCGELDEEQERMNNGYFDD